MSKSQAPAVVADVGGRMRGMGYPQLKGIRVWLRPHRYQKKYGAQASDSPTPAARAFLRPSVSKP